MNSHVDPQMPQRISQTMRAFIYSFVREVEWNGQTCVRSPTVREGLIRDPALPHGRASDTLDSYFLFSSWCGVNLIIANTAPCGSLKVENRPTFSMSIGGTNALAPNDVAFSNVASQSSTAK